MVLLACFYIAFVLNGLLDETILTFEVEIVLNETKHFMEISVISMHKTLSCNFPAKICLSFSFQRRRQNFKEKMSFFPTCSSRLKVYITAIFQIVKVRMTNRKTNNVSRLWISYYPWIHIIHGVSETYTCVFPSKAYYKC